MKLPSTPAPRVFSGMQPTGNLHLGNYLGAMVRWVAMQQSHQCIFCVVDMHAITMAQDPRALKEAIRAVTAAYMAAGIDPVKSILFNQSQVPEHAELAWVFPVENGLTEVALTKGFDWSKPMPASSPPLKSLDAIIKAYEAGHEKIADLLEDMSDEDLMETVAFPVAPKKIGEMPKLEFLWMLLSDQIHHRGQFSVYLRLAEAKVPSIYGPTADEPWV